MYLVRSGAIAGFEKLLRHFGINAFELIQSAGLSSAQFRNPNHYISYRKMAELLERCSARCGAPFFGFMLAEMDNPSILGDLPMTISQEPTVGGALTQLNNYIYLVAGGVNITQKAQDKKNTALAMQFEFKTPLGLNQLIQLSVASMVNITAQLMGVDRHTLSIHLSQAESENTPDNRSGYYPQTTFSSSFDGILLPASALKQRTHLDERALQLHFRKRLHHLQERYPDNFQNQVQALIGQLLPSSECSVENIAADLDLHPRMLQLKLQQEGTNYKTLLKQTRQTIAEQHLEVGSIAITDLALNLGFSDISVFSRSFKKWTGYCPREWKSKRQLKHSQKQ